MPVFFFAVAVADTVVDWQVVLVFFILHLLLYPASNGYNSYFDKDEQSIGGLKTPPKVTKDLYGVSIVMDGLAFLAGLVIHWKFSVMLLIYGLVSKSYSHPSIRLKSKPILGWLVVGAFQGYFTLLMTVYGVGSGGWQELLSWKCQLAGLLSSALLLGSYPMTQVYQHDEDAKRGDMTISLRLGVLGTFHFTGIFFFLSSLGFVYYFITEYSLREAIIFQVMLTPVIAYFGYWYFLSRKSLLAVNHTRTMRLNFISSLMLNSFFLLLIYMK